MKNTNLKKAVIAIASSVMILGCTPDRIGKKTVKTVKTDKKIVKKASRNFSEIITAESIRKNYLKYRAGFDGEKFKLPYEYIGTGRFKTCKISKSCRFYLLNSLDHPSAGTKKGDIRKTAKIISLYKTKTYVKKIKGKKMKYDANIPFRITVRNSQVVKMIELHQS